MSLSGIKCPNCHAPLDLVLPSVRLPVPASDGSEEAMAVVLAWPRCKQARLYQLLHASGLRIDAVAGIIARRES